MTLAELGQAVGETDWREVQELRFGQRKREIITQTLSQAFQHILTLLNAPPPPGQERILGDS